MRRALQLDTAAADAHQQTAQAIAALPIGSATLPVNDASREAELDRLILNAAILNGALELLPHTLATMAIVPLQMRMVYRIGSRYGYELDRGHIKDFLATVGVGLTSQVLEKFTQQLIGGFARRFTGGFLGGLVGQAAGATLGFATTYAVGQVAKRYYASGRTLSSAQLKEVFSSMLQDGRSLQNRYSGEIAAKSHEVNVADILPLVTPVFGSPALSSGAGGWQLSFSAQSGQDYRVLATSDLTQPVNLWTVLTNGTFGAGTVTITDPATNLPARFYLIVSP